MKIFVLSASLRKASLNRKLAECIHSTLQGALVEATVSTLADFEMPLYDGDLEAESGLPDGAVRLAASLRSHDALILVSPEYNFSIPGPLKNAIDWLSRERPTHALRNLPVLLASASPSPVGGVRGLWQLRIPLEGNRAHVHSPMFTLAGAQNAFSENGALHDEQVRERLQETLNGFLAYASALRD